MSRRKRGRDVHGWIALDKPRGMTSTQAVSAVRRLFDARKAGHAGTLDPLATGCLPIALGEATKTVPFVMDGEKAYRFTVRWGVETDTDDAEGRVIHESAARPGRDEIEGALPSFVGEILQVPPRFSAIKIEGERAYDLARDGEAVTLAPRPVVIDALLLVDTPSRDEAVLECVCGKGTYVRALARDLGRMLGTHGHVCALRRTRVGPFDEEDMIPLEHLRHLSHSAPAETGPEAMSPVAGLGQYLRPVETALDDLPALAVTRADAARLRRGQTVLLRGRDAPSIKGPVCAMSQGSLVALGEVERGELVPRRVFHLPGGPG
jgi:tRNA pseudouridine55 synthase